MMGVTAVSCMINMYMTVKPVCKRKKRKFIYSTVPVVRTAGNALFFAQILLI